MKSNILRERTVEITNFCPEECHFCSSDSVKDRKEAFFLSVQTFKKFIKKEKPDWINISGGEPMSHPDFYEILEYSKEIVGKFRVEVYSNAIPNLSYNSWVLPFMTICKYVLNEDSLDEIRNVRLVSHGRMDKFPRVNFSGNIKDSCSGCDHKVLRPNGKIDESPCSKHHIPERYVQVMNPVSKQYKLIDKEKGMLIASSEDQFPSIPLVEKCGKLS